MKNNINDKASTNDTAPTNANSHSTDTIEQVAKIIKKYKLLLEDGNFDPNLLNWLIEDFAKRLWHKNDYPLPSID